ncbi:carboxymuconolactone decarboxylase family protein [Kaistia dalseonensis]|nr:carboxymuconolactone decarboxylase family protein [Kaistia dalseonensis]MCX5494456.1 carboxymuconolactone decarboxylase family protein [Kaistia dalseonensis]
MLNDWVAMTREYSAKLRDVRGGIPDVMKGFSAVAQASLKGNALDTKTKELLALGVAVAVRCDPCIAFHAEAAVKQGASREEILETMAVAIYMGAGPSVMYAAKALEAFDQFAPAPPAA